MKKITPKQGYFLGIFIISLLMTAVMSSGMIIIRKGITQSFLSNWRDDFAAGCCIAIPAGYILVPSIEKLMKILTNNNF